MRRIPSIFFTAIWIIFRKTWWTFWAIIDQVTEGSDLD